VIFWVVTSCIDVIGFHGFMVKVQATSPPETFVSYHITTRRHNPEYRYTMNLHRREKLKSHIFTGSWNAISWQRCLVHST